MERGERVSQNSQQKSGLNPSCKLCHNKDGKKRHAANRERDNTRNTEYANSHKDQVSARGKAWRLANPERKKASGKSWYEQNRQKVIDNVKAWKKAHPDRIRADTRNRRARLRGAVGKHTATDIDKQYRSQRGLCWWCGKPFIEGDSKLKPSVDHIVPPGKGGTNYPNNLVIAHLSCNSSKNNRLPYESQFRRLL